MKAERRAAKDKSADAPRSSGESNEGRRASDAEEVGDPRMAGEPDREGPGAGTESGGNGEGSATRPGAAPAAGDGSGGSARAGTDPQGGAGEGAGEGMDEGMDDGMDERLDEGIDEGSDEVVVETGESVLAQLEEAKRALSDEREATLRARAEVENVRRRATRDVEQAHRFGIEGLVGELLPVRDGLELGIRAASEEGSTVESLAEGTSMTLRMLVAALEKFGAVEVDPAGEDFDPQYHQAMSIQESEGVEPGKVLQVFQKGCLLHGRVVRPAMVIVSR